jgi:hypothetical protein
MSTAPHRSRSRTGVENGDDVLEAIEALEEPTTAEIADYTGLGHIESLHAAGILSAKGKEFVEMIPARPANPRWRRVVAEDESVSF